jgi:dihydropteroate synthase
VAAYDVTYVAMHWRAHSDHMQELAVYGGPGGVVGGVRHELAQRMEAALAAGIAEHRLVLDPGLGFAKTAEQNWQLLQGLDEIAALGRPLLVGSSRKSFLGSLLGDDRGPRPVDEREHANVALTTLLAQRGVWGLRVHEVRASMDALRVVSRWRQEET